jgi:hypothetical protein
MLSALDAIKHLSGIKPFLLFLKQGSTGERRTSIYFSSPISLTMLGGYDAGWW